MEINDALSSHLLNIKTTTHVTYAQLAEEHFGDKTLGEPLRLALRKYKRKIIPLPIPKEQPFDNVLKINTTDALIISDIHAPYQNTALMLEAFSLAKAADIAELDIAGDLHNFSALSTHSKNEFSTDPETDINHARGILTYAVQHFNMITLNPGNHDEYYLRKKSVTFEELIKTAVMQGKYTNQIRTTEYDYFFRGDNWLIGHLSEYSSIGGEVAANLSDKYNRNVLVGHDHIRGHKMGIHGNIGASIGCMLIPDRFWYKQRRLNLFPPFQPGFALIKDNQLYLFDETGNTRYNGNKKNFDWWRDYFRNGYYKD